MPGASTVPSVRAARVLIADHCPYELLGLTQVVREHGWEVCAIAGDGDEAVARVGETRPDIVIMEYELPPLNGVQTARQIKRRAPKTEVLLFTGVHSGPAIVEIFRSSARGGMLKTEPLEDLVPALECIRRHHTFRSHALEKLYRESLAAYGDIAPLTPCEREILPMIADGLSDKDIAVRQSLSPRTINGHRHDLRKKLHARNAPHLIRQAIRFGLLEA